MHLRSFEADAGPSWTQLTFRNLDRHRIKSPILLDRVDSVQARNRAVSLRLDSPSGDNCPDMVLKKSGMGVPMCKTEWQENPCCLEITLAVCMVSTARTLSKPQNLMPLSCIVVEDRQRCIEPDNSVRWEHPQRIVSSSGKQNMRQPGNEKEAPRVKEQGSSLVLATCP